ncbi:MAG TPA: HmuY family protein [Polyangiaceae bacterium]|nr:HmuY family protein [Polyangiaceae bacterium]
MGGWSKVERFRALTAAPLLWLAACGSKPLSSAETDEDGGLGGTLLSVPVPSSGEALVALATPAVLPVVGEERPAFGWDLGFRGLEVFTNGGVSSSGAGAAFGLLSLPTFLSDTAPAVPFLSADQAGGAFRRWYAYDSENHLILSRFHRYGVHAAGRLFKVQLLGYYGGRSGDTSARYSLRFAEFSDGAALPTRELTEIDGSAAGDPSNPSTESSCVDLGTGTVLSLTPAQALARTDWHLCFRRDAVSVNGGAGGPGGVAALDLDAESSDTESVESLRAMTPEAELARFDALSSDELTNALPAFQTDRVVTAFSDRWLVPSAMPPEPAAGVWLVVGADGISHYLLIFERFQGASAASPGTVTLRVKAVL